MAAGSGIAATVLGAAYFGLGAVAGAAATVAAGVASGEARVRWGERCGFWERAGSGRDPWVWVHGASYGEAAISLAVARELRRRLPRTRVVATSTTQTGLDRLHADHSVESHWFPVDFAPFLKRVLEQRAPSLLVLVETEIWPATLAAMAERAVPVAVVNARLSDRSVSRYRLLAPLVGPALGRLAAVCARDEEAAARWVELGAPRSAVDVTGNIKFDLVASGKVDGSSPLFVRFAGDAPLLLGASTHAGEESVVLEAFAAVAGQHPEARLLLAPRHPGRAPEVAQKARAAGLRVTEWSRLPEGGGAGTEPDDARLRPDGIPWPAATEAVVLDRLGLLSRAYASADAAFVGGSLVDGPGGHNLLEAVMESCPPASGPHLGNVADQASVLGASGLPRIVRDAAQLSKFWLEVLSEPAKFVKPLADVREAVRTSSGALARTMERLVAIVDAAEDAEQATRGR